MTRTPPRQVPFRTVLRKREVVCKGLRCWISDFSEILICGTTSPFPHWPPMIDLATMKPLIWLPLACFGVLAFSSCANTNSLAANDPLGTGPFDSQGNYREDWADDPTKWLKPGSRKATTSDLPVVAANERPPAQSSPLPPARSSTPDRPNTTTAKPQPKSVAAKPKPKPKPTVTRHTVRKGDNLWSIANRNKTTVSAIQRANGISGSMIRPGQSLIIPKR